MTQPPPRPTMLFSRHIRRREAIAIAAAIAGWPLFAAAQQTEAKHVSILTPNSENDLETRSQLSAFVEGLRELGWTNGQNLRLGYRFGEGDVAPLPRRAAEAIASKPDAILAITPAAATALHRLTTTVPIVFVQVGDPVGLGLVANLARPGGNITGITNFEASLASKWLEILREGVPTLSRVVVLFDPGTPTWRVYMPVIEAAAKRTGVQVVSIDVQAVSEAERALGVSSGQSSRGLIVLPNPPAIASRASILALAARARAPAIYPFPYFAQEGGLIAYGPDPLDQHRQAASYVDRILRGVKPADLPIQAPTKLNLVINVKTAQALGLPVPQSLLLSADELIE